MSNKNLHDAKRNKKDEFYTQITDIEKELIHYKDHFKDKIVYCNCDDPEESNFFRYFAMNFEYYGLKKLITTHYETDQSTYKIEIEKSFSFDSDGNCEEDLTSYKTQLEQNGDFRSPESIELLKECDIVVTNPPFSLFREYVAQLIEYDKKFLIIGNMNAITYKDIFPLIIENKLWLGLYNFDGSRFVAPEDYDFETSKYANKETKTVRVSGVRWFINLDHNKRHEKIVLYESYKKHPEKFPKYDNYDAINIDKVKEIPEDYYDPMGVPITFIDKYNPEQFEILGISKPWSKSIDYLRTDNKKTNGGFINNKEKYVRILIERANKQLEDLDLKE